MGIRSLSTASISTGTKRSKVWDQSATVIIPNSYESIATISVGAGTASSVTFSSIPSTYKHLQIRAIAHANYNSSPGLSIYLDFNSDTASNYSNHFIRGNGSIAEASNWTSANKIGFFRATPDVNANSSIMSGMVCDIFDYTNTNKYKTVKALCGYDTNGATSGHIGLFSGNWRSTSAISTINITTDNNFIQYSSFALYGIKE